MSGLEELRAPHPHESSDEEVLGPCAECGEDEPCAPFDGRALCYDHWHEAREKTPPYYVRRNVGAEHAAKYGYLLFGGSFPSVLTEAEAKEEAAELNARATPGEMWEIVLAPDWRSGARRAHPGYMERRRGQILRGRSA